MKKLIDGSSPRRPPHGPEGVAAHLADSPNWHGSFFCWCDHCGTEGLLQLDYHKMTDPPSCPNCGRPVGVTVEQDVRVYVILDPPVSPRDISPAGAKTQRQAFNLIRRFPGTCGACGLMLCGCPEGPLPFPFDEWEDHVETMMRKMGLSFLNPCQRCSGCGGHDPSRE
jgi:hypothetical protein